MSLTKNELLDKWKKVRGMFPTKEENDFIDALLDFVEVRNNGYPEEILLPYIYNSEIYHKLKRDSIYESKYYFHPAEDWMPISLTYKEDKIVGFDCDGMGQMKYIGDKIENFILEKISYDENNKLYIIVKKDEKID